MTLSEAKRIEAEATKRNAWMIVRVHKTEYYFYPDMIDDYAENGDCYIYGNMVNPKRSCTNDTRWYFISNATFIRYQDK
jgi:hypothetical protein